MLTHVCHKFLLSLHLWRPGQGYPCCTYKIISRCELQISVSNVQTHTKRLLDEALPGRALEGAAGLWVTRGGEVASVLGKRRPSGPWMSSTVLLEAKHESPRERLWFYKACVLAVWALCLVGSELGFSCVPQEFLCFEMSFRSFICVLFLGVLQQSCSCILPVFKCLSCVFAILSVFNCFRSVQLWSAVC